MELVTLLQRASSSLSSVQGQPNVCHVRDMVQALQLAQFMAHATN